VSGKLAADASNMFNMSTRNRHFRVRLNAQQQGCCMQADVKCKQKEEGRHANERRKKAIPSSCFWRSLICSRIAELTTQIARALSTVESTQRVMNRNPPRQINGSDRL
jgi:hypothetical protein